MIEVQVEYDKQDWLKQATKRLHQECSEIVEQEVDL